MIPLLLYVLVTLDAAFAGYRAAAGRNALIDKRAYYRRAMLRGALAGQLAVLAAGGAITALLAASAEPSSLWTDMLEAGRRLVLAYVPYALVILAAFVVRTIPSVDVRSLTSTLVFGPLTFIRPVVVVAGLVWGAAAQPRPALLALAVLVGVMMLTLEPVLRRRPGHPASP